VGFQVVSIIIQYETEDEHYFKRCWHPLIYKHGEMDFIIVDKQSSAPMPDVRNCRVVKSNLDALAISQKTWFGTPVNEIPTYQTMIMLQESDGKEGHVDPKGTMYNIREML